MRFLSLNFLICLGLSINFLVLMYVIDFCELFRLTVLLLVFIIACFIEVLAAFKALFCSSFEAVIVLKDVISLKDVVVLAYLYIYSYL